MKRKVLTRVLSLFCALISVLMCMTPTASAAEAPQTVPYYDVSDVADDLESVGINTANYVKGEGDFSLIYAGEVGYKTDGTGDIALYLYVYNPSGKALNQNSVSNTVQLASGIDSNGSATGYAKYRLTLIDNNDNVLLKFKIGGDDFAALAEKVGRSYRISGITLTMYGQSPKEAKVGKAYTFTGEGETLSCSVTEHGVAEITLHPTTYDYNNGVTTNTVLYSVYFSIDPKYEKENVTLTGYKASAYRAELSPVAVVDSSLSTDHENAPGKFYDTLLKYRGKSNIGKQFPFLTSTILELDGGGFSMSTCSYGWNVSQGTNSYPHWLIFGKAFYCHNVFKLTWMFDRPLGSKFKLDNAEIKEYAVEYSKGKSNTMTIGGNKYALELFTAVPEYQEIVKSNGVDSFEFIGAGANGFTKFFLEHFWNVKTEDILNIDPVVPVNISDVNQSDFADRLFIGDDEAAHFKEFVTTERGKGNKVYLLRFATESYWGDDLFFHYNGSEFKNDKCGTLLADAVVYLDFDVMELYYTDKQGNVTVLPVVSDPVDVIPDFENPVDEPSLEYVAEDIWAGLKKAFAVLAGALLIFCGVWLAFTVAKRNAEEKREERRRKTEERYGGYKRRKGGDEHDSN